MNAMQQIFCLFFAVFWGIVGNVQPRWKAFHWPYVRDKGFPHAARRLCLSMVLLNVLPITYFGVALCCLASPPQSPWPPTSVLPLIIFGVLPAFAGFSFYRIWLSFVEHNPDRYYPKHKSGTFYTTEDQVQRCDPEVKLYLSRSTARGNMFAGVGYLVFGIVLLVLHKLATAI